MIGWFVAIALFGENGYSYWKDRRERAQNVCYQLPMVEQGKKPMGSELRSNDFSAELGRR